MLCVICVNHLLVIVVNLFKIVIILHHCYHYGIELVFQCCAFILMMMLLELLFSEAPGRWSFHNSLVVMRMIALLVVHWVVSTHSHIDNLNRFAIHENVYVFNRVVQHQKLVCNEVELKLSRAT